MVYVNEIIGNNIMNMMQQKEKTCIDLADYLGISKSVVYKMLSGGKMINAFEMEKIAEFLGVSREELIKVPCLIPETNIVKKLMEKVKSSEAKEALKIADEISDIMCFYARVRGNAQEICRRNCLTYWIGVVLIVLRNQRRHSHSLMIAQ